MFLMFLGNASKITTSSEKKNFKRKKSAACHKQLTVRIPTVILQKATIKNLVDMEQGWGKYFSACA